MRAYRPGLLSRERCDERAEPDREEKLRIYIQRAREGAPLFEPSVESAEESEPAMLHNSSAASH